MTIDASGAASTSNGSAIFGLAKLIGRAASAVMLLKVMVMLQSTIKRFSRVFAFSSALGAINGACHQNSQPANDGENDGDSQMTSSTSEAGDDESESAEQSDQTGESTTTWSSESSAESDEESDHSQTASESSDASEDSHSSDDEDDSTTDDDSADGSDDESSGDDDAATYGREVLSWVPPYDVERCLENLDADFGEYSPKNVLTSLALQFWRPTAQGELVYEAGISDETVNQFRAKGDAYGIKILLCVYNNNQQDPGWDWPAARAAFVDHPEDFAHSLFATASDLGLGGVDIDFEGYSSYESDREPFRKFLAILSEKLHANDMILTVDTFHSPCFNAPNMAWWKDWAGIVDHVHSMGYGTLYEANDETFANCPADPEAKNQAVFRFSYQSQYGLAAGLLPGAVSVGLPDRDAWGQRELPEHLQDILGLDSPTSIAFWDFALRASSWRESETWKLARAIRDTK
jgi:hypothetical protein